MLMQRRHDGALRQSSGGSSPEASISFATRVLGADSVNDSCANEIASHHRRATMVDDTDSQFGTINLWC